jgi:hypothetical protein
LWHRGRPSVRTCATRASRTHSGGPQGFVAAELAACHGQRRGRERGWRMEPEAALRPHDNTQRESGKAANQPAKPEDFSAVLA